MYEGVEVIIQHSILTNKIYDIYKFPIRFTGRSISYKILERFNYANKSTIKINTTFIVQRYLRNHNKYLYKSHNQLRQLSYIYLKNS